MKKFFLAGGIFLAAASAVYAQGPKNVHEHLDGYQEDPASISTAARGEFHGRISNDGTQFAWELTYRGLEGAVQQAHIHLGRHSQTGGVMVFLCTNLANGPAGTQACPAAPATISGVLTAADVVGPVGQGIAAGEFAEFLRAIRADAAYVNVHSSLHPGGEIRANIEGPGRGNGNGNGNQQ